MAIYNFVVDTFSYDYDKINNIDTTYVPDIEKVYQEKKVSVMIIQLFWHQCSEVRIFPLNL